MSDLTGIRRQMDRVDWDFPKAGNVKGSVHSAHWFPGNFIPQIPAYLTEILSEPGDVVFDPCCGSGTTGLEAVRLGRRSLMSDAMSACILHSAGKIALLERGVRQTDLDLVFRRLPFFSQWTSSESVASRVRHPDLSSWYCPSTLAQLEFLWDGVESTKDAELRAILRMVFSDVLYYCATPGQATTSTGSRRRHHWGWVADNVFPKVLYPHDAALAFAKALSNLACYQSSGSNFRFRPVLIQQDARRLSIASETVDLVVTSPPYIGVIDYTKANRLLYEWMGWDIQHERDLEVGARSKRWRKGLKDEYLADIRRSADEIARVLKANGFCAIVIGESGKFPGTAVAVVEVFGGVLDLVWGPSARTVSRRRVSGRLARNSQELVCLYRKRWS